MSTRILGVIPARFASSRFPGKALAPVAGKPMLQHVYERAVQSRYLTGVLIATDDERIATVARQFGGRVCMTSTEHLSGTDRLALGVGKSAINMLAGRVLKNYRLLNLRYGERFVPQDMNNLMALPSGILGPIRFLVNAHSNLALM